MTPRPQSYTCLAQHPENTRWGEGCGQPFVAPPGPVSCPHCGALYVRHDGPALRRAVDSQLLK